MVLRNVFSCLLSLFALQTVVDAHPSVRSVEEIVAPYLASYPHAATVVGIVRQGETQITGFGHIDQDNNLRIPDGNTIYQIGSITKVFTATLLAEQIELGNLQLSDKVQDLLPAEMQLPPEAQSEMTLLDLATHHSGLPVQPPFIGVFAFLTNEPEDPYALFGKEQLASILPNIKLKQEVGKGYHYSNLGMGLLGHALVESTSFDSYDALLKARVTVPLNMEHTGIQLTQTQKQQLVPGYTPAGKETTPWHFASLEGCGAIFSTAADLLRFIQACLAENRADALHQALWRAQQPNFNRSCPGGEMGLGWHCTETTEKTPRKVWHNGGTSGYRSIMILVPQERLGVVVLSNVGASVDGIGFQLIAELLAQEHHHKSE